MDFESEIKLRHAAAKNNILSSFVEAPNFSTIEKALSFDEFKEKYSNHQIFTKQSIDKFEEDFKIEAVEKGMGSLEISKSIQSQKDGLEIVFVKSDKNDVMEFFVKPNE